MILVKPVQQNCLNFGNHFFHSSRCLLDHYIFFLFLLFCKHTSKATPKCCTGLHNVGPITLQICLFFTVLTFTVIVTAVQCTAVQISPSVSSNSSHVVSGCLCCTETDTSFTQGGCGVATCIYVLSNMASAWQGVKQRYSFKATITLST